LIRRAGTELAVMTYEFNSGTTTLVKNFCCLDSGLADLPWISGSSW